MKQLEQVILGLTILAEVTYQVLAQGRVLNAVFLFAAFPQRASIETDDGGMTEVRTSSPMPGILVVPDYSYLIMMRTPALCPAAEGTLRGGFSRMRFHSRSSVCRKPVNLFQD